MRLVTLFLVVLVVSGHLAVAHADEREAASSASVEPSLKFYVEDIKHAMQAYVEEQVDSDGIFYLRDDKTGDSWHLPRIAVDPLHQGRAIGARIEAFASRARLRAVCRNRESASIYVGTFSTLRAFSSCAVGLARFHGHL